MPVDQHELSSRLSQVVEANELPKVLMRSPILGQADSALDSMTAQETDSRPRHGSLATPYVNNSRSRAITGFSTMTTNTHDNLVSPSVEHTQIRAGRPRRYTGYAPTPRRAPASEPHYNDESTITDSVLQRIPVMEPPRSDAPSIHSCQAQVSGPQHNDNSTIITGSVLQAMPVISPQRSGPAKITAHLARIPEPQQDDDSTLAFATLQNLPVIGPEYYEAKSHKSRRQNHIPKDDELHLPDPLKNQCGEPPYFEQKVNCTDCNRELPNFHFFQAHFCCLECDDVFPSEDQYNAHLGGKKHESRKLCYEYCAACDVAFMGLEDHLKERDHKRAVKKYEAENGTRFVMGGGNAFYGVSRDPPVIDIE